MKHYFLGIDPGVKGAFAVIDEDGTIVDYWRVDKHELTKLETKLNKYHYTCTVIERAGQMSHDTPMTAFSTGKGYGKLTALLELNRVRYLEVHPRSWQTKILGKFATGKSKERCLQEMSRMHPGETFIPARCRVVHDGVVDAVAIAHYARRYGVHQLS